MGSMHMHADRPLVATPGDPVLGWVDGATASPEDLTSKLGSEDGVASFADTT